jgi:hypothetical protein
MSVSQRLQGFFIFYFVELRLFKKPEAFLKHFKRNGGFYGFERF